MTTIPRIAMSHRSTPSPTPAVGRSPELSSLGICKIVTMIITAAEIIPHGLVALVVFSRCKNLELRKNGTGWTGFWKIDREKQFEKVVLYLRNEAYGAEFNTVYLADRISIQSSDKEGRSTVMLANVKNLGRTASNWFQFAEGGPNPVRYVSGIA